MAWKETLTADPTEWLLEPGNPAVRYWALRDLEGRPCDDPLVMEARSMVPSLDPVKTILSSQSPEGYWVHEEDMYNPKYRATTHQLLLLAEHAAPRSLMMEKAVEQVFRFQRESGHFLIGLPKTDRGRASVVKDGCCIDGNVLFYLVHFGYLDDPRTQGLLRFIEEYYDWDNGGWLCRAYPIDAGAVFPVNCYMGATKILKAFSVIPAGKRSSEMNRIIGLEVEKILENGVHMYIRSPDGSRREKAGWKRFGYPRFYQSDILEVLDTLTRLGVRDERMEPAVDVVRGAQQPDGRWLLKATYGKMWVDIEEKNKPSKWVTLRALRVLKGWNV